VVKDNQRGRLVWAMCGWLALALLAAPFANAAKRGVVLIYEPRGEQAKSATARTALVIGNGSYSKAPLRNPVNDATNVAEALQGLGFEIVLLLDVNKRVMRKGVSKFRERLQRRGGIGLFYYAGHGIQVGGRNYLIPVGANIEREVDVEFEAVDAGWVLGSMEDAKARLNVVILDACRDNPYERSWRSAGRGLARLELPQGPLGSFLAYSTAPGKTAADGTGRNSPFTKHLLANLAVPDIALEEVFKRTRIEVKEETKGRQIPWSESALLGDFYFRGSTAEVTVASPPTPQPPSEKATLTVRSNVTGDTVYIDDSPYGPTGPRALELAPGEYRVRVEKPDYEPWETTIALAAGEQRTLNASLVPPATAVTAYSSPAEPKAGEGFTEPVTSMEFVWVPGGCFEMGSGLNSLESPVHRVCMEGFWLGKYEVTQGQWEKVMGSNPALFKGDDLPVETVSWDDAQAFIAKLNQKGPGGFRLPSEAQWEYACRSGGQKQTYCGGEDVDRLAWSRGPIGAAGAGAPAQAAGPPDRSNEPNVIHPVGTKAPNGLGLHDMSGNVWEWVQDCWHDSYQGAPTDGRAWEYGECDYRVFRGGAYGNSANEVRATVRNRYRPLLRTDTLGFRPARTP